MSHVSDPPVIDASFVWPKVEIREIHECWPWLGGRNKRGGHGVAYIGGGRSMAAHRAVWQIVNGPIDRDLVLDHLCRHPWCVNPMHCEPVLGTTLRSPEVGSGLTPRY